MICNADNTCGLSVRSGTCNDNNACTTGEVCQADGTCGGGTVTVCDTPPNADCYEPTGTCNADGSCSYFPKTNGATCETGNLCTADTCVAGVCTEGDPNITCPDPDQCHLPGTCDPDTGVCSNPIKTNGATCNDGLFCTATDTCQGGICTGTGTPCSTGLCLRCDEVQNICISTCGVGFECKNGSCVPLCPKRTQSTYCPSTTGKGFKCCPTDSICDYRGGVTNCRNA